jgi:hypothetical protein
VSEQPITAPTAPHVLVALGNIMQELEAIGKTKKNEQQRYNFRGIDQVYNALHPLFARHRILMRPRVLQRIERETQTKSGGAQLHVIEEIEYDFTSCVDGSSFTVGPVWGEGLDMSDKASNKCMSAAQKYALIQTLLIPTEDVVDADNETIERGTSTQPPPRNEPPQQRGNGNDHPAWRKFKETNEAPNGDAEPQHQPVTLTLPTGDIVAVPEAIVAQLPRHLSAKPFAQQNDVELSSTIALLDKLAAKSHDQQNRVVLATIAAVARGALNARGAA